MTGFDGLLPRLTRARRRRPSLVFRQGRCDMCGRRVVRGAAVPRAARAHGAVSYCRYEGSVYDKEGRRVGFVFGPGQFQKHTPRAYRKPRARRLADAQPLGSEATLPTRDQRTGSRLSPILTKRT